MESYYDILKINKEASKSDIKKAYARLLKQYPPETHPEEFKIIRAAYETLGNDDSRRAYDAQAEYSFNTNTTADFSNRDNDNYTYNSSFNRNPYSNSNFTNSAEISPESDFKEVLTLFNNYYHEKNYNKAIEILNSAIDKENKKNSNNIIYYLELVKVYNSLSDLKNLNLTLIEFFEMSEIHQKNNTSDYIFDELKKLSLNLYANRKFYFSKAIARYALQIHNSDSELVNIMKRLESLSECKDAANKIKKDHNISVSLNHLIELWFDENANDEERSYRFKDIYDEINSTPRNELYTSLKKIKNKYKVIYNADPSFFNKILNNLEKSKQKQEFSTDIPWRIIIFFIFVIYKILTSLN